MILVPITGAMHCPHLKSFTPVDSHNTPLSFCNFLPVSFLMSYHSSLGWSQVWSARIWSLHGQKPARWSNIHILPSLLVSSAHFSSQKIIRNPWSCSWQMNYWWSSSIGVFANFVINFTSMSCYLSEMCLFYERVECNWHVNRVHRRLIPMVQNWSFACYTSWIMLHNSG